MELEKKQKKILIIEDDAMLMRLLVKQFKGEKIEVLQANNGQAGLQLAIKECPGLIILDVIMPKMDGLTVIKGLRAKKECKKIPILLWTNLSEQEVKESIDDVNSEFLAKAEWSLVDLVKKVKKIISL